MLLLSDVGNRIATLSQVDYWNLQQMHTFESNSTFLQGLDSLDVCLGPAIGCRDCNDVSLSFFLSFFSF